MARKIEQRRKWQPIPVFLPGESHGQRSLASPWGHKESDVIEVTEHHVLYNRLLLVIHFKYSSVRDTTLMAESEDKLKSLLMQVKEESGKSLLKAQHSEN